MYWTAAAYKVLQAFDTLLEEVPQAAACSGMQRRQPGLMLQPKLLKDCCDEDLAYLRGKDKPASGHMRLGLKHI